MNARVLGFASLSACLAFVVATGGCAVSSEESQTGSANEALYTQTIVYLHADGTSEQVVRTLTASQIKAQMDRRAERKALDPREASELGKVAQAIGVHSCDFTALLLNDQTNFAGNQICFWGAGTATLANYSRGGTGNWNLHVRSHWAGDYGGYFSSGIPCTDYFTAGQIYNPSDACVQASSYVTLYGP